MNNISDFFYNIVPGFIFLVGLFYFFSDNPALQKFSNSFNNFRENEAMLLAFVTILSLFVGFLFQALTKLLKDNTNFFENLLKEVSEDDRINFNNAEKYLSDNVLIQTNDAKNRYKNIFYLMQNYLESEMKVKLVVHFGVRQAFWANTGWGSLILLTLTFLFNVPTILFIKLGLIAITLIAFHIWWQHLRSLSNIVLKTFVSQLVIEKGVSFKNSKK